MQSFSCPDPVPLPPRFTLLKEKLASGNEAALTASWHRLLQRLEEEVEHISSLGSNVVPTIDFANITNPEQTQAFRTQLRRSGVAIIRNVIPKETATTWRQEASEYLSQNPGTRAVPTKDPQLYELYWSPAQIKARAHPSVIAAQKFAMGIWESKDPNAKVSTNFPVTYADRVRIRTTTTTATYHSGSGNDGRRPRPSAHVDNGSVERWEPDGYGRAGTYKDIFDGRWEDYNPWEVRTSQPTLLLSHFSRPWNSANIPSLSPNPELLPRPSNKRPLPGRRFLFHLPHVPRTPSHEPHLFRFRRLGLGLGLKRRPPSLSHASTSNSLLSPPALLLPIALCIPSLLLHYWRRTFRRRLVLLLLLLLLLALRPPAQLHPPRRPPQLRTRHQPDPPPAPPARPQPGDHPPVRTR